MSVWNALIGAGGSILSSLIGGTLQHQENTTQYHRQQSLLHETQDYNTEMWNANNEYNTPAAQLQRFTDAGFSPNVAASMMSGTNSTQVASPTAPSVSATGSTANAALSGLGALANLSATLAQAKKIETETAGQQIQNDIAAKDLASKDDFINLTKEQLSADIRNTLSSADLNSSQKSRLEYETSELLPSMKAKTDEERAKISQDIRLGIQELANLVRSGQLLGEQIHTQQATQAQIYEQIRGARFDNAVRELHARLASDYGIDVNSHWISLLAELSLSGSERAEATVNQIVSTVTGVFNGITGVASDVASPGLSFPSGRRDWLNLGTNVLTRYAVNRASPYIFGLRAGNRLFQSVINP